MWPLKGMKGHQGNETGTGPGGTEGDGTEAGAASQLPPDAPAVPVMASLVRGRGTFRVRKKKISLTYLNLTWYEKQKITNKKMWWVEKRANNA